MCLSIASRACPLPLLPLCLSKGAVCEVDSGRWQVWQRMEGRLTSASEEIDKL